MPDKALSGKAVVVRRGCCTFAQKTNNAVAAGAAAVIVTDTKDNAPAVQMTWAKVDTGPLASHPSGSTQSVKVPVCLISKSHMTTVVDTASGSGAQPFTLDFSGFQRYDPANEVTPTHMTTFITVVEPYSIRWQFPLAQASFNPLNYPAIVGEAVKANLAPECIVSTSTSAGLSECDACWKLASPFTDPASLKGHVVLFYEPTACYSYWFQLPAIAQEAGAAAAIQIPTRRAYHAYTLPRLLPPYLVPFNFTIPCFTTTYTTGTTWAAAMKTAKVLFQINAAQSGSGPNYHPSNDEGGSVPDSFLRITEPPRPGQGASTRQVRAGQATFMPDTFAAGQTGALATAKIDPACALDPATLVGGKIELETKGIDCDTCHDRLVAKTLILNKAALKGTVALFNATDVFCVPQWSEITLAAQAAGATAVVFANHDKWTYTLSSNTHASDANTHIPTFNLGRSDGGVVLRTVANNAKAAVTVLLPEVVGGVATALAKGSTTMSATEIQILSPSSTAGFVEAAQASFNPTTHPGVRSAPLVRGELNPRCDSLSSCHLCQMLDQPLQVKKGRNGGTGGREGGKGRESLSSSRRY